MNGMIKYLCVFIAALVFISCEDEIRNIADNSETVDPPPTIAEIIPVDINSEGFDLLENMQGHWIGTNKVIADEWDWFGFDYRPISPSHIFGIFEGGSLGNLFTSFFVTDFKGTRTIMARNGGLLNGIYRTSYFVMDSVNYGTDDAFYRLVDAEGGTNTMWMELRFVADSLYFNAYTSGLGQRLPTRHMTFKAQRQHPELATNAAAAVGFPKNEPAWDFSDGFMEEYLQASPNAKSATFLAQDFEKDVFTLAQESGDPWTIEQIPHLGYLLIDVERNPIIEGTDLFVNLSMVPLTDDSGYFNSLESFNTILLFSQLIPDQSQFLVTYLHPGDYYLNITADVNGDGIISTGDYTHEPVAISIAPGSQDNHIIVDNITVEN